MDKKRNDFVIFCIEMYKKENGFTGKAVFDLFKKHGVISYLWDGYDMLHTQGHEWLMQDIGEYLKNRGFVKEK